jgi:hypothetical protein
MYRGPENNDRQIGDASVVETSPWRSSTIRKNIFLWVEKCRRLVSTVENIEVELGLVRGSMFPRLLLSLCLLLWLRQVLFAQSPDTCPVTKQSTQPFVPPLPFSEYSDPRVFCYGSDDLWTSLPANGVWLFEKKTPPAELRLLRAIHLWRQPSWDAKSKAKLIVTASRLDAAVPTATGGSPWGGWLEESQQVVVNIRFPTSGCWRVTARYEESELTFTALVGSGTSER